MGKFGRSWKLMKISLNVLRKDKEILLFPVLSFIACVVVLLTFIGGFFLIGLPQISTQPVIPIILMFVMYLFLFFVIIFFNTAVIACAHIRLNGGDPRVADGLHIAGQNIGRIFLWALISATIGLILQAIRERSGLIGKIIAGMMGLAWAAVTFFIIPVLIYEKRGMVDSIKRSATLFRQTWGETIIGSMGFGLIFVVFFILGFIPLILGFMTMTTIGIIAGIIVAVIYWAIIGTVYAATTGIYVAAMYHYATTKQLPEDFNDASLLPPTTPGFI
jgi:hypothetical protein